MGESTLRVAGLIAVMTTAVLAAPTGIDAQARSPRPDQHPAIRRFLDEPALNRPHPMAPPETRQFGRLVGVWEARQEIRRRDGSWMTNPPGVWAWKYVLGGYATQDLWLQPQEALPEYLGDLGRDYALTALRMYDAGSGTWRVAWAANGGGETPGDDFGTFEARETNGQIVMDAPGQAGTLQRIVFSDITPESFRWTSSFSNDGGATWEPIMRITATRIR